MRPAPHPLLLLVLLVAAPRLCAMDLAAQGKPLATIVVGPDATEPERYAAAQLATYLKRITDADFPVSATPAVSGGSVFVGQTAATKARVGKFDWAALRGDGILIRTLGADLIIAGDRPRGTVCAVVTFLEDQLGVRWWTAGAETVPHRRTLCIGDLNTVYKPPFLFRDIFARGVFCEDGDFPSRLRTNGHWQSIPPQKGGHYSILGMCHTFYELLPPAQYFAAHPDWYSEIGGKRVSANAQLCLSNPEMADELLKQALVWIRKAPQAGMISVSQNDCGGACTCANCQALVQATGSQSGALISFVNRIAAGIAQEYPDFLVETLAYTYTRAAPTKIRPRDNVIVRLCSIECDFAHPLTAPSNAAFYQTLRDWRQISRHLYIWDYTASYYNLLIPHTNLHVFADNLRTFRDNHVIGVFEQGDGYNMDAGFAALETWVLCHLMWDPRRDEDELVQEFLAGYYGPAAPALARYLDLMRRVVVEQDVFLSCSIAKPTYYNLASLTAAHEAMQQALAAVRDDAELYRRVRLQNLALQHLLIVTKRQLAEQGGSVPGVDWSTIAGDYLGLSDYWNNVFIGENTKMSDAYRASLGEQAAAPATVPRPAPPARCVGLRAGDWADFQETQFTLIGEGAWVKKTPDPAASNGLAAVMPGAINEWAMQLLVQGNDIIAPAVNVYASVAVTGKATAGPAFTWGVYDQVTNRAPATQTVMLEQIPDRGYHEYSLGTVRVKPGMFIYLAPPGSGDLVESMAVDRVYFTRTSQP